MKKNKNFCRYIISTIFLLGICPFNMNGQISKDKIQQIDNLLKTYAGIKQFNGNALVLQKGKTVFYKSYGLADFDLNVPNDRQTKFKIGSVTKQFTAMLILQLMEQGLVSLDSTIHTYLPWYPGSTGNKVTVRQLLSHTSGLKNYTQRPDFHTDLVHLNIAAKTFAEKYCRDTSLLFEPGTKFYYCNTNYYLLGLIIEAVTGKQYAQVLRENILNKVGMLHTGIDSFAAILPKRAKGYEYSYNGFNNATAINMATSTYAAGAMYSTVDDLALWDKALQGNILLRDDTRKLFFTPGLNNHSFGLYINKTKNGKTAVGHPGGIKGFSSFMVRFVEDDITIILLNNITGATGDLDNTSFGIYSILSDQPYELPKMPVTIVLAETYKQGGFEQMLKQYQQIKNNSAYNLSKSSSFLNDFGYTLLMNGKVKESLKVLEAAVLEFPQSANTLDSYAEALKTDGQYELAIEFYKKILALEPNNKVAAGAIVELQSLKK